MKIRSAEFEVDGTRFSVAAPECVPMFLDIVRQDLKEALAREKEVTEGHTYGQFLGRIQELAGDERWVAMRVFADYLQENGAATLAHAYRWAASRRLWPNRISAYDGSRYSWRTAGYPLTGLPSSINGVLYWCEEQSVSLAFWSLADALAQLSRDWDELPQE